MKSLDQLVKELPPARRKKVERRTADLITEELTLQELRKAHQKTQVHLAKTLGMTQDQVSRLEQRTDVLLSTLRRYIEGMGGDLTLIAQFPNHEPVKISGLAQLPSSPGTPSRRPRKKKAA